MWKEAVAETGIIFYLMLGVGIVGILAKVMNYVTLRKLVNAAGSMSKSTHKLMKLVRAKYEHACMVHDRVENVNAFVEKYIYEYRGFFLKIHTWRQIQIQSIWFAGILAAIGAVGHFMAHGFCEQVYQYGALGAAEMVALFESASFPMNRIKSRRRRTTWWIIWKMCVHTDTNGCVKMKKIWR